MKMGRSLERAAREAMTDLRRLSVPFPPRMNLVAVSARGSHVALTTITTGEAATRTRLAQSGTRRPRRRPRLEFRRVPRRPPALTRRCHRWR